MGSKRRLWTPAGERSCQFLFDRACRRSGVVADHKRSASGCDDLCDGGGRAACDHRFGGHAQRVWAALYGAGGPGAQADCLGDVAAIAAAVMALRWLHFALAASCTLQLQHFALYSLREDKRSTL